MKKMFVLLMMVFALSIGMTTSVQASGVGNDFDVGYTITQWTPAADMQHFCMDAFDADEEDGETDLEGRFDAAMERGYGKYQID